MDTAAITSPDTTSRLSALMPALDPPTSIPARISAATYDGEGPPSSSSMRNIVIAVAMAPHGTVGASVLGMPWTLGVSC
jgi:hypothetical protein